MLKRLLINAGRLIGGVYPLKIGTGLALVRDAVYSTACQRKFKNCGNNFSIVAPFNIIGFNYIQIGNNFSAFMGLRLEAFDQFLGLTHNPRVQIGNNVSISYDCHIGCSNEITIGNNVLIAGRVFITDHYHGSIEIESMVLPPGKRPLFSKGAVNIEDNVWIGEGVVILPGITIGESSIIGANSVVSKSIPRFSVAAGTPAKIIKTLK
jgi:acetyltransferase-like isoleucine patch superfamily enzyme